jgi:hypothetical protein
VYGWKVLVLIDVQTRLPLAMKVLTIQAYEGRWLVPLLEQAQRNLGTGGQIGSIVIERGYLDGADLWQVHQLGVRFVVVAKANMVVTQDAQALAKRERGQVRPAGGAPWTRQDSHRGAAAHRTGGHRGTEDLR